MLSLFKIVGAIGIVLLAVGMTRKNRKAQDVLYIGGGLCLEAYSIYLGDWIFIVLQIIFTLAAAYDLAKITFFKK